MRPTSRVVLVHPSGAAMGAARRRAERMAATLEADLLIARLGRSRAQPLRRLLPGSWLVDGGASLSGALHELRVLSRWTVARQRAGLASIAALALAGEDHLLDVCRAPGVDLVVVPAKMSARAPWLARRAGVPVLLAHEGAMAAGTALLAATNLLHPQRPVLHRAADLAKRLRTGLNVVHNLPGFAAQLIAAGLGTAVRALPDDAAVAAEQERQLQNEVGSLGLPATVAVTRRLDAVTGILEAASQVNADLIVMGARRPHLFERRVCERVCNQSERSVLLVPA